MTDFSTSTDSKDTKNTVNTPLDDTCLPDDEVFQYIDGDVRLTQLPIARPNLHELYMRAKRQFWDHDEIDFSGDRGDYLNAPEPVKHFVKFILAFFAPSDTLVNINITDRFAQEVNMRDATNFYDFQKAMENIHGETYAKALDAIIANESEYNHLAHNGTNIPGVSRLIEFIVDTTNAKKSLAERLLRMACCEGVFFTACFCAIYRFKEEGWFKGLCQSNELIARDEALHTEFATELYKMIKPEYQLSRERVVEICHEAVAIAKEFARAAIPEPFLHMNANLMGQYIESTTDSLAVMIGQPMIYGTANPFDFMKKVGMNQRPSFFEIRPTTYSRPAPPEMNGNQIAILADF